MGRNCLCSSESLGISILTGPGLGNCVGRPTNGPFLTTSSCASMRVRTDFSLPYLVFVYQLTDVVSVTMQLSNVTVLDNCILHMFTGLIEMFVEASRHVYF